MEVKKSYANIDEYIAAFPLDIRNKLTEIRLTIKMAAPEAREKISYGMPAFEQSGILVYFAAHKNHLGFYPTGSGIKAFETELGNYKYSKGAIQFPFSDPLPLELVIRIVKFRINENQLKAQAKIRKKL